MCTSRSVISRMQLHTGVSLNSCNEQSRAHDKAGPRLYHRIVKSFPFRRILSAEGHAFPF
jgi:hypothetical protein